MPAVVLPAKRAAASARIRTDKRTYFPGQIVAITGSGWEPGETVCLLVHETSSRDPDALFFATADAAGNIFNDQFSPDPVSATTTFAVTARGQSSELQAQTTFAHKRATSETRISPRATRPADTPAKENVLISDQLSSRP